MPKRSASLATPESSVREIERKFLVRKVPAKLANYRSVVIEQGYLCFEPSRSQVRVRCVRDEHSATLEYYLTVKRKNGMVRDEVNVRLSRKKFEQLWALTTGRRLRKRRYNIPYEGRTIELDVFEGACEGLVMAEVEFPDEKLAHAFVPPSWFGREVTRDPAYRNVTLATEPRDDSAAGAYGLERFTKL